MTNVADKTSGRKAQESTSSSAEFDDYAHDYEGALAASLSVSGESQDYFAEARINWLKKRLPAELSISTVMDFGCGTGNAFQFLIDVLGAKSVIGIDPSPRIREIAQRSHADKNVRLHSADDYQPRGEVDLVFSNGTFHHIKPEARGAIVDYIARSLQPGGLFVLSENNPWNPGTRYVMSRCAFDQNAIPLSARESRRLLSSRGFEVLSTDFLFIFPRALRVLRPLESMLEKIPIGAQYQIICRKPE